jgi:hypothetical protein
VELLYFVEALGERRYWVAVSEYELSWSFFWKTEWMRLQPLLL